MSAEMKVIMVTDQVGFTPATARRTPAEIERIAREQDELTRETVREHGGTVLKDSGDGAFIEFPSCSDAVRCGFVLQQRVKARSERQSKALLRFELHVGIDVGEVVVLPNADLRGNAANVAARVCAQCPPGEVYLTARVASELHPREARVTEVGTLELKGVSGGVTVHRLVEWLGAIESAASPFVWRKGITEPSAFFDRERELKTIRAYLHARQNCQLVGPRRIGKTSLLRQVQHLAGKWEETVAVAYLDLQDPRCFTLSGCLEQASGQFGWATPARSLAELAEGVDTMLSRGGRPVLCLDEFDEMRRRPGEFTRDVFMALRASGQRGMAVLTTSQQLLSTLTDPKDPSSPFYNTFPVVQVGPFSSENADDFLALYRPGVPPFEAEEQTAILEFAKGHPLALQVACLHVLQAKEGGEPPVAALQRAAGEMAAYLPPP